jgi:hypothetical protein
MQKAAQTVIAAGKRLTYRSVFWGPQAALQQAADVTTLSQLNRLLLILAAVMGPSQTLSIVWT